MNTIWRAGRYRNCFHWETQSDAYEGKEKKADERLKFATRRSERSDDWIVSAHETVALAVGGVTKPLTSGETKIPRLKSLADTLADRTWTRGRQLFFTPAVVKNHRYP